MSRHTHLCVGRVDGPYSKMAEFVEYPVESYEDALTTVIRCIELRVDPRKLVWCDYAALDIDEEELQRKIEKSTSHLQKQADTELLMSDYWFVGVPRLKIVSRGVPYLACQIDLYYVACGSSDSDPKCCWYDKLVKKADTFDVPLCLIPFLSSSGGQKKGKVEASQVRVVERARGYSTLELVGREWKVPDAFVGFVRALREKRAGFEGLLDPESCRVMARLAKEKPSADAAKPPPGTDCQDVVSALEGLGYPKATANDAAKYAMDKAPQGSTEAKVKEALRYMGG